MSRVAVAVFSDDPLFADGGPAVIFVAAPVDDDWSLKALAAALAAFFRGSNSRSWECAVPRVDGVRSFLRTFFFSE